MHATPVAKTDLECAFCEGLERIAAKVLERACRDVVLDVREGEDDDPRAFLESSWADVLGQVVGIDARELGRALDYQLGRRC